MIGHISCDGCTYSGHPHNEDCPEASHNKYPDRSFSKHKYYDLHSLMKEMSALNFEELMKLLNDHRKLMATAMGSSKNHQAWEGGYLAHIVECLNIAVWLYDTSPRRLPFARCHALEVLFLHDLEKPFKQFPDAGTPIGSWAQLEPLSHYNQGGVQINLNSKQFRKEFRNQLIRKYGIQLSDAQWNALAYVEGVPDSEYSPGERTMGELAAFCHCCDILSARLWYDEGKTGAW